MNLFKNAKTALAVMSVMLLGFMSTAQAALDGTEVAAIMTGVQTDAQTAFDAVLPVVGVVLGLVIGLKLLKRFANKV